jgi:pantothenate kinase type III
MSDFLEQNHIEKKFFNCIISSVVTSHTMVLREAVEKLSGDAVSDIIVLDHQMEMGLNFKIKAPEELGTDRLANPPGHMPCSGGLLP